MKTSCGLAVAVVLTAAAIRAGGQQPTPSAPVQTFRTGTDVVLVDVSVRDGGQPVTGLSAGDFELTDNGVRQRIEAIEATAVPIDLTLVTDLSGNPGRPWTSPPSAAKVTTDLTEQLARVVALLQPTDRVRLFGIDDDVQVVIPFTAPGALPSVQRVRFDGIPALYDTLAAALLYQVIPARRHVVIAATKGHDANSSIDAQAVRALAERSDALFHLVLMEGARDSDDALKGFQCSQMGYCWPTRRFWMPFRRTLFAGAPQHELLPEGDSIARGVEGTGGSLHQTGMFAEATLYSALKKTLDDFRSGYMLRYTMQGVPRAGWHAIKVRVAAHRSYAVRARTGYAIEEPPVVAKSTAAFGTLRRLDEYTAAFERGEFTQIALALRGASDPERLMREFETGGNPWPANPRREAVFTIDLAEPGAFSRDDATHKEAITLLERFTRLVRHPLEADSFELYWHFGVLTLLEGSLRPADTEAFAERALERFPGQPRLHLSRAIIADQRSRMAAGASFKGGQSAGDADRIMGLYAVAMGFPDTAAEAHIRAAWVLYRIGRYEEALAQLNAAGARPIEERALGYLRHLFLGHVLAALKRDDEAVAAFRAALEVWPAAQSARVALMNTLLMRGERAEAETLAEQIQTDKGELVDPWWTYWQGQYRMHGSVMARLRELMVQ